MRIALILLILLVCSVFFVAIPFHWDKLIPGWDTPYHLASGICLGIIVASYYRSEFGSLPQPLRFFCVLGIVMAVGVLWEFHEYALGRMIPVSLQGDLDDTMKDLLMDTLGGVAGGILNFFRRGNA